MLMFALGNMFMRSPMINQVSENNIYSSVVSNADNINAIVSSTSQAQLYIGLIVMSGFVLFDTQNIMEKRRIGSTDCIKHSVELFIDLISLFRRILIILTQKVSEST